MTRRGLWIQMSSVLFLAVRLSAQTAVRFPHDLSADQLKSGNASKGRELPAEVPVRQLRSGPALPPGVSIADPVPVAAIPAAIKPAGKTSAVSPPIGLKGAQNLTGYPAAEPLGFVFPDYSDRSTLPDIRSKNPGKFIPVGLRYGPKEKDIAVFIFDGKKGNTELPDELHLYIAGHPQLNTPKVIRGKQEEASMAFKKVAFSAQSEGFTREIVADVLRGPGDPTGLTLDLTVTTLAGKDKSVMLYGLAGGATGDGGDKSKFLNFSILGVPKLNLRAFGDGTQLSASLVIYGSAPAIWHLMPLLNMDKEIIITVIDSNGTEVETTRMSTTLKTFKKMEAWTGKLKNLKKDQKYTVKAKINLGPWYGDVTAEVVTLLISNK